MTRLGVRSLASDDTAFDATCSLGRLDLNRADRSLGLTRHVPRC